MKLANAIQEIIAAHREGIGRTQIENELRTRQVKGSSPANVKRVLAQLAASNGVVVDGKSVARVYKAPPAGLAPVLLASSNVTGVFVSKDLLEEVRNTARSMGMADRLETGDFIDAVLRDWISRAGKETVINVPGHTERVQWVLDLLRSQATNGQVGPVGAKAISREIQKLFPGRRLSVSFIVSALKELVQREDLKVEVGRAGPVGCIYRLCPR